MRNIIVLSLLLIVFYFTGCESSESGNSTIHNQSSFEVTFRLVDTATGWRTLQSGDSITIRSYGGAALNSFESSTPNRVRYTQINNWEGRFVDLSPIPVVVYSHFSFDVTLSAGGYLEGEPITIEPGKNDDIYIFTRNPRFTVTANGFPATIDFQITDDTMYVVIR